MYKRGRSTFTDMNFHEESTHYLCWWHCSSRGMLYQGWWTSGRWDAGNEWAVPPAGPEHSSAGSYHCSSWSAAFHRAGCRPRWAQWHSTPLGWSPHLDKCHICCLQTRMWEPLFSYITDGVRWGSCLTIFYFSAKLALFSILKQRLVALDFIPRLTAWLIEQSAISTRCRAKNERNEERCKVLIWAHGS